MKSDAACKAELKAAKQKVGLETAKAAKLKEREEQYLR